MTEEEKKIAYEQACSQHYFGVAQDVPVSIITGTNCFNIAKKLDCQDILFKDMHFMVDGLYLLVTIDGDEREYEVTIKPKRRNR